MDEGRFGKRGKVQRDLRKKVIEGVERGGEGVVRWRRRRLTEGNGKFRNIREKRKQKRGKELEREN